MMSIDERMAEAPRERASSNASRLPQVGTGFATAQPGAPRSQPREKPSTARSGRGAAAAAVTGGRATATKPAAARGVAVSSSGPSSGSAGRTTSGTVGRLDRRTGGASRAAAAAAHKVHQEAAPMLSPFRSTGPWAGEAAFATLYPAATPAGPLPTSTAQSSALAYQMMPWVQQQQLAQLIQQQQLQQQQQHFQQQQQLHNFYS